MTYFKGKCGEGLVKNYKCNISTKDGKSFVQADNWNLLVKKGCMIVEKLAQDEGSLGIRGMHAHSVAKQNSV
jgi:hypothetical protein